MARTNLHQTWRHLSAALIVAGSVSAVPQTAAAQHAPTESVISLAARGDHFSALVAFDSKSAEYERSVAERTAAFKSSWALGLLPRARKISDELLADRAVENSERARLLLMRSILELQDEHFDDARSFAEEGAAITEATDVRSQLWLTIAESLRQQKIFSSALTYYERAMTDAPPSMKAESAYLLGECQMELGQFSQARYTYTSIPISASYAAKGLKRLVEIDQRDRNSDAVLRWIEEGSRSYATDFEDSTTAYARVRALLELGRLSEAEQAQRALQAKFSSDQPWSILGEAAVTAERFRKNMLVPAAMESNP